MKRLPIFHKYSIKDLENLSNIKAHTLRIWEQRYGILKPSRTDTNIRFYTDDELRFLLSISMLNQNGFKISKIAGFSTEDIQREVRRLTNIKTDDENQVSALVIAMINLDEDAFTKLFNNATARLGFEQTVIQVIYPFLQRIGMLWIGGSIRPVHEHFISNLIREKLIIHIHAHPKQLKENAKSFLLFTPENEWHELTLLFNHYLLKTRNHKVIYVGLNIPLHDLLSVFENQKPDYLITCITTTPKGEALKTYLKILSQNFEHSRIIISGEQVRHCGLAEFPQNVTSFNGIVEFISFINEI